MTEPVKLSITGPGPYGFRLFGGNGTPLAVAKLRVKSKAYEAGLREGDVILGINGLSCQKITHADAVNLLENSVSNLDLHYLRNVGGQDTIDAAFASLSSDLLEPPTTIPEAVPQSEATRSNIDEESLKVSGINGQISTGATTQPPLVKPISSYVNEKEQFLQRSKESSMFEITKGPSQDRRFDKSEEVIVYRHVPNMPQAPVRLLSVPLPITQPSPVPSSDELFSKGPKPYNPHSATAVCLTYFTDEDSESKENRASLVNSTPLTDADANFRVANPSATPWKWQPSQVYKVTSKPMEEFQLDPVSEKEVSVEDVIAKHAPKRSDDPDDIPLHLLKVLTTIEDIDPNYFKRKKIFADSMFYDDPEHKYPTIQEQIKMARRVALSLTAPVNVRARGQQMFIKKKEKSQFWDIDNPHYQRQNPADDLYYKAKPWRSSQPVKNATPAKWSKAADKPTSPMPWNKKVEVPKMFKINEFSTNAKFPVKSDTVGRGKKRPGVLGGSQVSFSQSDELVNKKGKAGQLFARRRAKSEEPEEREPQLKTSNFGGSQFRLERLLSKVTTSSVVESQTNGEVTVPCRLKQMIEEYHAGNNPWESGRDYSSTGFYIGSKNGPKNITTIQEKQWSVNLSSDDNKENDKAGSTLFTSKNRKGYGPIRFKAPPVFDTQLQPPPVDSHCYVSSSPESMPSGLETAGVSDF
jgi:hypothetical protein